MSGPLEYNSIRTDKYFKIIPMIILNSYLRPNKKRLVWTQLKNLLSLKYDSSEKVVVPAI